MMTKDKNLTEFVKPYAKDRVSHEIILGELNKLRPEEDGVYRTFPAALDAVQKIKATFRKAGIEPDEDTIYTLCQTFDDVYLKGIAHGISIMIDNDAPERELGKDEKGKTDSQA